MAIKKYFLTGDTHSKVAERLAHIPDDPTTPPEEIAIIILGDAGFNFWLNTTDIKAKREANKYGYKIYCVRGNHEERPENIDSMETVFDENVCGPVFMENEFPNIRYFKDGGIYDINGHKTLVIGGAYSVDKWYRLARAGLLESENNPAKSGWFSDEMLTPSEMDAIGAVAAGQRFDLILSHTCPILWEPTDLFLDFIDQSTVDKTMEIWMDELRHKMADWGVWCFGHFHADRIEAPRVQQFYYNIEDLETVWNRWFNEATIDQEYWLEKSPNYYMEESK